MMVEHVYFDILYVIANESVMDDTFSHPKYHSCMHFNL